MGTLTIRNVPDTVLRQLEKSAERTGSSAEQEARDLLCERLPGREKVLSGIRARWEEIPNPSAAEVDSWLEPVD